jgi:regulator of sigma E protease
MNVLHNLFFFILALGVLITFHEFGHYWVARRLGVKVLRFSIGFGKPLFRWTRDHDGDVIEYVIAALPLGGYVKMADEREGEVAEKDRSRAFNTQRVWKRFAIVIAGPGFNFILAVLFYWLVFVIGTAGERALIGAPEADSLAAQAGFANRDEILAVDDSPVDSWNGFRIALIDSGLEGGRLPVTVREDNGVETTRYLELGDTRVLEDDQDIVNKLGFRHWWPDLPPELGGVIAGGAAEAGGLLEGDRVLAVDDKPVQLWKDIVDIVRHNPERALLFHIERDGHEQAISVIPRVKEIDGEMTGYIGAYQHVPDELRQTLEVKIQYGVFESVPKAIEKTWDMSLLTLRVLWKMLTGEAALTNISGPITIAQYAGVTASIGFTTFIGFLAIISVSLGVLNLLPVPMLDGGHLFYYVIEIIKGSPVSETIEMRGQQIGIVILACLMMLALFNDFQRLLQ